MNGEIEEELEKLNWSVSCNDSPNSLRHAFRLTFLLFVSTLELYEKTNGVSTHPAKVIEKERNFR